MNVPAHLRDQLLDHAEAMLEAGESEPGIVISQTTGEARPRFVATKAGAFGDAASLDRARLDIKSRIAASHGGGPAIRMFFHTDTTTP